MEIGIELGAERFELLDAVFAEPRQEVALGEFNSLDQGFQRGPRLLAGIGR